MTLFDDIKQQYSRGDRITQLIIINVAVFLGVLVVRLLLMIGGGASGVSLYDGFLNLLMAHSSLKFTLIHFWTPFTYMFLHEGLWHIFFNMLYLHWFGRILQDMGGRKLIVPIYLAGGLAGWLAYILSTHLLQNLPIGDVALGASASVMAIIAAAATLVPHFDIQLIIIGRVELRWVALFLIVLDLASINLQGGNNGGHLMHLGGVAAGWFFIWQLQRGADYADIFEKYTSVLTNWFAKRRKPNLTATRGGGSMHSAQKTVLNTPRQASGDENNTQVVIDEILEKIKRSGINSLSDKEREWLYKASKNKDKP